MPKDGLERSVDLQTKRHARLKEAGQLARLRPQSNLSKLIDVGLRPKSYLTRTTGTLQARIMAVVVDPMIRLRMRLCP